MTPEEIDVIVRVAGATLLMTAAALLSARDERGSGRYFLPLAICLCGFLAGNTPDPGLRMSDPAGQMARFLSGFAAVFLWWFCLSVFDRTFRPRGLVLATGVAWLAIAAVDRGLFGEAFAEVGLSPLLIAIGFLLLPTKQALAVLVVIISTTKPLRCLTDGRRIDRS